MKIKEHSFIQESAKGTNPWWAYAGVVLASIAVIIVLNQFINRIVIPALDTAGLKESISQEMMTFVMVGMVFGALILVLKFIYPKLHKRKYHELINSSNKKFRLDLYFKGVLQWGILLILSHLLSGASFISGFSADFHWSTFLSTAIVSALALFLQTYWEELFFRGYLLQNMGRKFGGLWVTNFVVSLLFSLAHFGYGFQSFIQSFIYSFFLTLITLKDNGLERASGIHFINNFLLLTFFVEAKEITNATFNWSIDFLDLGTFVAAVIVVLLWSKVINKDGLNTSSYSVIHA